MSRYVLGNCVEVMSGFPDKAVDLILIDPLYLVGFRDRSGRTLAGDKTDEWLQSACYEMYRFLKKDALMISFYGWNRVDRFMAAWKNAGFSVVGHPVFQFVDKNLLRSVTPDPGVDQQREGRFQPKGDEDPRQRLIGKVGEVKAVARKRPKPQLSPGLQSFFSA